MYIRIAHTYVEAQVEIAVFSPFHHKYCAVWSNVLVEVAPLDWFTVWVTVFLLSVPLFGVSSLRWLITRITVPFIQTSLVFLWKNFASRLIHDSRYSAFSILRKPLIVGGKFSINISLWHGPNPKDVLLLWYLIYLKLTDENNLISRNVT